ncbi:MAG TPA: HAD-IA family hydrolase [Edaphobacter sp.]
MSELVRIEAQGLLFDMDGVLISSIGSVVRSWRTWAKKYGVPDADSYVIPHGMRAIEIIKTLRPDIDPQVGLREIEDLELEDTADLVVLPGARELLESLPADRWTIVTSATRRLMLGRLEVAGLPVPERIVSADDVQRGKPDPEPYRKGAELLGFRPQDCVVIEDAPSGIGAGKAAGARVLGVIGTHTLEELHEADWAVRSLTAVSAKVGSDVLELQFQAE